jgi:hypothetical protein
MEAKTVEQGENLPPFVPLDTRVEIEKPLSDCAVSAVTGAMRICYRGVLGKLIALVVVFNDRADVTRLVRVEPKVLGVHDIIVKGPTSMCMYAWVDVRMCVEVAYVS